uniref:Uncharacterized protein n=1 Tax=Romanomermis culicivorax TaxID=13658 RepID=A0A915J0M6_ROMCU
MSSGEGGRSPLPVSAAVSMELTLAVRRTNLREKTSTYDAGLWSAHRFLRIILLSEAHLDMNRLKPLNRLIENIDVSMKTIKKNTLNS